MEYVFFFSSRLTSVRVLFTSWLRWWQTEGSSNHLPSTFWELPLYFINQTASQLYNSNYKVIKSNSELVAGLQPVFTLNITQMLWHQLICRFRRCCESSTETWRVETYHARWTSRLGWAAGASDVNRNVVMSHLRLGLVGRVEQRLQLAVHRLLVLLAEFLLELCHRASGQIWEQRHKLQLSFYTFHQETNTETYFTKCVGGDETFI